MDNMDTSAVAGTSVDVTHSEEPLAPGDVLTPGISATAASGSRKTRQFVKPRTFDGLVSWREYQSQFNRVALLNEWSEEEKVDYLWVNLTGSALSFVEGLPAQDKSSYQTLCHALESRFGAEHLAMLYKAELLQKTRKKGQSLPELAQEVRKLSDCAYPNFPVDAKEELATEKFIEALQNAGLRLHLHQASPKSLTHAVELATHYEALRDADSRNHPRVRMVAPSHSDGEDCDDDERGESSELCRLVKRLSERLSVVEDKEKTRKCYNCGRPGHLSKECRSAKNITCYNCGSRGHMARDCKVVKSSAPGN